MQDDDYYDAKFPGLGGAPWDKDPYYDAKFPGPPREGGKQMPAKDLTRWALNEDGSWSRYSNDDKPHGAEPDGYVDATSGAITAAEALGIDLSAVTGTGSGGRITKADVENAAEEG